MKIYNVSIYSVAHHFSPGSLKFVDYALVKKNLFSIREVVTNKKIKVCSDTNIELNMCWHEYAKYNCVLGVKETDLNDNNLATQEDLEKYLSEFNTSNLYKILKKMNVLTKEETKIKRNIKNIGRVLDESI